MSEDVYLVLDPENRPYFGTHRQICEQLFNDSRFAPESTVDEFITGALHRLLGANGVAATPENLITAVVTAGMLRFWPPGAKLFPADPQIEERAELIARASLLTT